MSKFFKKENKSNCEKCSLYKDCISPYTEVLGKGKKKVLIIGNPVEDLKKWEKGSQIEKDSFDYISNDLKDLGIDINQDCWWVYPVRCISKKYKEPTKKQVGLCRDRLKETIAELKPEKIILLGRVAVEAFLGDRTTKIGAVSRWIGFSIPDQSYKCWVFPIFHPSYIVRNQNNWMYGNKNGNVLVYTFYDHLANAIEHKDTFPVIEYEIKIYEDYESSLNALKEISKKLDKIDLLSFDYEGSGIKPHRKEQFLKSISLCYSEHKAFSMPIFRRRKFLELLKIILTSSVPKTAHNLKLEEPWTRIKLGYSVNNWYWDSMLAAHCIDNRGKISSLKHQTYLNFGIIGYENEIEKYTTGTKVGEDENSGNKINRIDEAPLDKLLYYGGLDALFSYKLAKKQIPILKGNEGYKLFLNGMKTFVDIEINGWGVNTEYYKNQLKTVENNIQKIEQSIIDSEENTLWREHNDQDINIKSFPQLAKLFFDKDYLGFTSVKETDTGNNSTDSEVLQVLSKKSVVAKGVLQLRKEKGILDKINQHLREIVDDKIHPSYNLHITKTFRSSCNNPNKQNDHKRDVRAREIVRSGIIPSKGKLILSRDFSGVEVAISCVYHKDPVMIEYIKTSPGQMHTDEAYNIFLLEDNFLKAVGKGEKWAKLLRFIAKNNFVFAQFYGDYYVHCAKNIWEAIQEPDVVIDDGTHIIDYLKEFKIKGYKDFEDHIKDVEDVFWNEKFKVYKQWKEDYWNSYIEKGYLELLSGFICTDIMTKNECINKPIQGTAYHITQYSINHLNDALKNDGWKSKIIGQIHDDVLHDADPNELDDLIILADEISTKQILKDWTWINVPLKVENEISEIDGNWAKMKETHN